MKLQKTGLTMLSLILVSAQAVAQDNDIVENVNEENEIVRESENSNNEFSDASNDEVFNVEEANNTNNVFNEPEIEIEEAEGESAAAVGCTGSAVVGRLSGDSFVFVRSSPSRSSDALGKLFDGEEVEILGYAERGGIVQDPALGEASAEWAEIDFDGQTGYVSALYLVCVDSEVVTVPNIIIDEPEVTPNVDEPEIVIGPISDSGLTSRIPDTAVEVDFEKLPAECLTVNLASPSGEDIPLFKKASMDSESQGSIASGTEGLDAVAIDPGQEVYDGVELKSSRWILIVTEDGVGFASAVYASCAD